jgi:hypothetical protein
MVLPFTKTKLEREMKSIKKRRRSSSVLLSIFVRLISLEEIETEEEEIGTERKKRAGQVCKLKGRSLIWAAMVNSCPLDSLNVRWMVGTSNSPLLQISEDIDSREARESS